MEQKEHQTVAYSQHKAVAFLNDNATLKIVLLILALMSLSCLVDAQIVNQYNLKSSPGTFIMNQSRMDNEGNLLHGGYQIDTLTGTGYCSLAKTDRFGNNIWAKTVYSYGYGIPNVSSDGSCQLLCTTPFPYLARYTKDGQLINGAQFNFQRSISPKGTGTMTLPNGRIVIIGNYATHDGNFDVYGNPSLGWILYVDSTSLSMKWYQQMGIEQLNSSVEFNAVAMVGNYIYIGGSAIWGYGLQSRQSLLLKLDTNGTIVSRNLYNGPMISAGDTFKTHAITGFQVVNNKLYCNIKAAKNNRSYGDTSRDKEAQVVGIIDTGTARLNGLIVTLPDFHYLNDVYACALGFQYYYLVQSPSVELTKKSSIQIGVIDSAAVIEAYQLDGDSTKSATGIFVTNDTLSVVGNTQINNSRMTGYLATIRFGAPNPVASCPLSKATIDVSAINFIPANLTVLQTYSYYMDRYLLSITATDSLFAEPHCPFAPQGVSPAAALRKTIVYPNPGKNYFYIEDDGDDIEQLVITSITGKKVTPVSWSKVGNRYLVKTPEGLHGIYFYFVQKKQGISEGKWQAE